MLYRQGFTIFEIIVVLIIIGVLVAVSFPNFVTPSEQARASNAQNNLLAIYSAQQNYRNNNTGYCYNTGVGTCGDILADLNTNLSLNIQDDGTYLYQCPNNSSTCTATRAAGGPALTLTLTLNLPVQLQGASASRNPACAPAGNLCP